ncbi:probable palmitoyltransferase ZDHHC24 [Panonychus citri]|uniref:probable palmitoyltransferase ZDHHC24 n=1 Tax=Panonychus citri TaxID=50023 RepID=UPI00230805B9|nr:probable palmitoyltransferase ZDHHC24 [Panonychus citri]
MKIKRQSRKHEHSGRQLSFSSPQAIPIKVKHQNWDGLAFIFFFVAVIGSFLFEVLIVVPKIYSKDANSISPIVHNTIGLYILHNIMGNFIQIIRHQSTIRGQLLISNNNSSSSVNNQRYCWTCETYTPPRSYHCPSCDVCILKQDHHCSFAKSCIGFNNFRYFISLLFHIAIGSFYCTTLNMFFIWDLLGGFTLYNFLSHTFPFLFWLFGRLHWYSTICCLISIINIAACLFTTGLIFYHCSTMIVGQTVHERAKSIQIYDLGCWKLNCEQSFGSNWKIVLISPLIPSKLPGNGKDFPTRQDYHLNSSKTK